MADSTLHQKEESPACSPSVNCRVKLCSPYSSERGNIARYIADKYREEHRASLSDFLPILLQVFRDQTPVAACGLQPGHYRPFFLEQYLDQPIEQHVARIASQPVDRLAIMEIGNLVVTRHVYGPLLLVILAASLAEAGYEWMVFTATEKVSRLVRGMGFDPHYLVLADPRRLKYPGSNWGTYYENNPQVMVGNIAKAMALIENNSRLQKIAASYRSSIHQAACSLSDYRRLSGESLPGSH